MCSEQLHRKGSTFDWDDELRNNGENLVSSFLEEIVGAQDGEGTVGIEFLSASVEEDGKVVVVIQRFD